MNIATKLILAILVFLAISSGITKIILIPQDAEFFGKYGFTDAILISFGAAQFLGGAMLILLKTRFFGALIVAITFIISAVLLVMEGSFVVALITLITTAFLIFIMVRSTKKNR